MNTPGDMNTRFDWRKYGRPHVCKSITYPGEWVLLGSDLKGNRHVYGISVRELIWAYHTQRRIELVEDWCQS